MPKKLKGWKRLAGERRVEWPTLTAIYFYEMFDIHVARALHAIKYETPPSNHRILFNFFPFFLPFSPYCTRVEKYYYCCRHGVLSIMDQFKHLSFIQNFFRYIPGSSAFLADVTDSFRIGVHRRSDMVSGPRLWLQCNESSKNWWHGNKSIIHESFNAHLVIRSI